MKRFFIIPNRPLDNPNTALNRVWVGDITYLKVGTVYRYLAVVMDKCSRLVGWAFGRQKNVVLTLRALNHTVSRRRPPAGLIFLPTVVLSMLPMPSASGWLSWESSRA